jgi:hypothetical protein
VSFVHRGTTPEERNTMSKIEYEWDTVAFTTCPPGWRVVCIDLAQHGTREHPVVGWLTQEERAHDAYTAKVLDPDDDPPANRAHRVVAGIIDDGEVRPGFDEPMYWYMTGPGYEYTPTQDDIDQEIANREARAAKARAAREAKS